MLSPLTEKFLFYLLTKPFSLWFLLCRRYRKLPIEPLEGGFYEGCGVGGEVAEVAGLGSGHVYSSQDQKDGLKKYNLSSLTISSLTEEFFYRLGKYVPY